MTAPVMQAGEGALSFLGFAGPATYEMPVRKATSRAPGGARGALLLQPSTARDFYRAGSGSLVLDDGRACRIVVLGHTEGSDRAYFEVVG